MKRGKTAFWMVASSLVIAFLMIAWPVKKPYAVEAVRISSGRLVKTVLLKGTVAHSYEYACVALRDGTIAEVYVRQGQPVKAGEMLFRLDTAAEERALAAMRSSEYQTKISAGSVEETLQVLAMQKQLEWMNAETELKSRLEMAAIRAPADGVMEKIDVQKGEYVIQASVVGVVRDEKKAIVTPTLAQDAAALEVDSAAYVKKENESWPLRLARKERTPEGADMLVFEPMEDGVLADWAIGENVQLEGVLGIEDAEALIPLSAFDSENRVWWIENGKAQAGCAEPLSCNDRFAAVSAEWLNRLVILHPDGYGLQEGMPVQVKE